MIKNPFVWLTSMFKQTHAGTIVCQAKPTTSFIARFQENKHIKGNVRAVEHSWLLPETDRSCPSPFPAPSAISDGIGELSCCVQPGHPVPGLAAAIKSPAELQRPFLG